MFRPLLNHAGLCYYAQEKRSENGAAILGIYLWADRCHITRPEFANPDQAAELQVYPRQYLLLTVFPILQNARDKLRLFAD